MSVWKASKVKPQELIDHPETPPHFAYIWDWFLDLPPPITWTEIKAWSEFSGMTPARWEGEILIQLDHLRK